MVNREKWNDFVFQDKATKAYKQLKDNAQPEESYTSFTCPYDCGKAVEMLTSVVSNSKGSLCKRHLEKCKGVAPDGCRAQDDERLLNSTAHLEGAAALPVAESTALTAVRTELATKDTALVTAHTELVAKDTSIASLQSRVDALTLATAETDARFKRLESQFQSQQSQLEQERKERMCFQEQVGKIAQGLGYPLPAPPIDTLLTTITDLRTRSSASKRCKPPQSTNIHAHVETAHRTQDLKELLEDTQNHAQKNDAEIKNLFDYIKKMRNEVKMDSKVVSPDKQTGRSQNETATACSKVTNRLLEHLTPEAYKDWLRNRPKK